MPLTDRFRGTMIRQFWTRIESMSSWSPGEIRNWQTEKLKKLINHVYHHTRYYKELFNKLGLRPDDFKDITDLQKLPVLTKMDIINNSDRLTPDNLNEFIYKNVATGGSTGVPLKYRIDKQSFSYFSAYRHHFWEKIGFSYGNKHIILGGRSIIPDHKDTIMNMIYYNLVGKIFLNGVNMSDQVINQYLDVIYNERVGYLYGYPSAIYLMACQAETRKLIFPELKVIITTGEMFPDDYRAKINAVFNCKAIDSYGAMDGGIEAFESKPGTYHVGYNSIAEVEERSAGNHTGNILATDLLNYASPFIRYQIGDEISLLGDKEARNEYNGQIITKIYGRDLDIIRLENGHSLTGIGFTGFFRTLNIRAFRVVQLGPMHIKCIVQKTSEYTKDEETMVISTFKKQAGEACKISIRYVEEFEPVASGKRKYFIANTNNSN